MRFDPASAYRASTFITPSVPSHLLHLVLPGFKFEYVYGPWGGYLSQWFNTDEFEFWLQSFAMVLQGKLYPHSPVPIFALQHMVKGNLYSEINNGLPIDLSERWSQFMAVPANIRQVAYFHPGPFVSCHIVFKKPFLHQHGRQFPAIASVIDNAAAQPNQVFVGPAVMHDHRVNHLWKSVPTELKNISSPELYLAGKCRDLFRLHCENLNAPSPFDVEEALRLALTPKELIAAQQVKNMLENDVSNSYPIRELAEKTGLNNASLKRAFKVVYKSGIHQYLIDRRLEFGYQLILTTNDTIRSIAHTCGYENPSHFNLLFKRKYGIEPMSVRNG